MNEFQILYAVEGWGMITVKAQSSDDAKAIFESGEWPWRQELTHGKYRVVTIDDVIEANTWFEVS